MARKIILVEHHDEPRDVLASTHLPKLDFTLEYYRPFAGESLPEPDEDTAGIIITGGAANVDEIDQHPYLHDESRWIEQCLNQDIPTLGLCLGAQLLAHVLGAPVVPHEDGAQEFGLYPIEAIDPEQKFVPDNFLRCNSTAGASRFQQGLMHLQWERLFQTRPFAMGPMYWVPSFTLNAHWPSSVDGKRWKSLPGASLGSSPEKRRTDWRPSILIMRSTGSSNCSKISLPRRQIPLSNYSRYQRSIRHVVT